MASAESSEACTCLAFRAEPVAMIGSAMITNTPTKTRTKTSGMLFPFLLVDQRLALRLGWNTPITLPSGPIPFLLKVKISCMLITFSSIPVISEMLVTLRVPSLSRSACTTMVMAEAICWRTDFSFRFMFPMATMDSSLETASRGVLA